MILRCYKSSKPKKKKEIALKKRKSYAELEPVKKRKTVRRGFVISTIMLKTKRKTANTCNPVSHVFKKKGKGRARLQN